MAERPKKPIKDSGDRECDTQGYYGAMENRTPLTQCVAHPIWEVCRSYTAVVSRSTFNSIPVLPLIVDTIADTIADTADTCPGPERILLTYVLQ